MEHFNGGFLNSCDEVGGKKRGGKVKEMVGERRGDGGSIKKEK